MRILIVCQYFWPEAFRVNDLAAALTERGNDVTVLTGQPNYESGRFFDGYSAWSPACEDREGVHVVRVPLVSRGSGTGIRLAANYASFALSASVLAPVRIREHFDVVLVYQLSPVTMALPAFVLKWRRSTPVLFWIQDLWPEALRATGKVRSERVLGWMRSMVARMYRASDRVLVQSRAFVPAVEAAGVPRSRIEYLPNWAEPVYRPVPTEPDAPEQSELPAGFRVMFAGNIGVAQSVETMIDAAALGDGDSVRWVVIGDGRRREWAERRVEALGLGDRFTFLGRRPVEAMPRYLAAADVTLVTLRRDPSFALTVPSRLQSYLACAKPVIAALDGEGARVVEEAGAGFTCPAEDIKGLASAVQAMRDLTSEERERMGASGRAYFERHFEREVLVTRLERWLAEVARA